MKSSVFSLYVSLSLSLSPFIFALFCQPRGCVSAVLARRVFSNPDDDETLVQVHLVLTKALEPWKPLVYQSPCKFGFCEQESDAGEWLAGST